MRGFLVFLVLCNAVQSHSFSWYRYGSQIGLPKWKWLPLPYASPPPPGWSRTWKQVGDLVEAAPPQKLHVEWPNNVRIEPNATISTGWMTERPTLSWPSNLGELYTVMIVDGGIKAVLPKVYVHWMVSDIPGNSVEMGNEVMQYVTPFGLELNEDGSIIKDAEQSAHPMILMVFKQPGPIVVKETQFGCSPDIFLPRVHDYRDLVEKYSLQLVAGNFLQAPWSGYYTQQMLCRFSKCTKEPFPLLIPGVNDLPECQPRKDIIDMTIVGPKLSKRKDYAKYISLFSPYSLTTQIKDLYPAFSTGKIKNFRNVQGAYDGANNPGAYIGANNQADILEGVVDTMFINYPNKTAAVELLSRALELIPVLPKYFPTLAGGKAFKIILSQPYNQDFDFETVISKPGMVFDLNIVKRKDGDAGKDFLKEREDLIVRLRNNKNVVSYQKFKVDHEILENESGGPLSFDSSNNYISFITFESLAAREKAFAEIGMDMDFLGRFYSTFECIVCATLTENLHPTFYPPFN